MENLLYSFFIENNHNSLISFQRIKRFLSNKHFDDDIYNNRLDSLYKLLNTGVIDYSGNSKYYLSPSIIINAENFKIGINLPTDVAEVNKDKIINQYTGVTLFNNEVVVLNDWDIINIEYKFDNYISNFTTIFKIPLNWRIKNDEVKFPNQSIKIEIFDDIFLNWRRTENLITSNSLYKVYTFSNDYFEDYYFYYNRIWYKLKFEEYEKVKLAKTILSLKGKLAYNSTSSMLSIPKNFPLPSFIEKLLFLNHCLAKGKFPEKRHYFMERKDFKKVNKVIFNNHIKIAADE